MAAGPFGRAPTGARLARCRRSPQFRDGKFRNAAVEPKGRDPDTRIPFFAFFTGAKARKPARPLPTVDPRPAWAEAPVSGLRVTWLGHSTTLVEIDGATLLVDPVWSARASPFQGTGPKRFQAVPVALDALPPIDAIVLSHDHYDHLDHPTMLRLAKTRVPFVAPLGVGEHLEAWGVAPERITELDWWDETEVAGVKLTSVPAQHFSGRGPGKNGSTLWTGYAFAGPRHKVYFSGDTGPFDEFAEITRRAGPFDLAMIEAGANHPSWGDIHLGPERALDAFRETGAKALLPIHWGTFDLALHRWDEPAETILRAAPMVPGRLVMPTLGAPTEPASAPPPSAWWRAAL